MSTPIFWWARTPKNLSKGKEFKNNNSGSYGVTPGGDIQHLTLEMRERGDGETKTGNYFKRIRLLNINNICLNRLISFCYYAHSIFKENLIFFCKDDENTFCHHIIILHTLLIIILKIYEIKNKSTRYYKCEMRLVSKWRWPILEKRSRLDK